MRLSANSKSITLLAVGVASTSGATLRRKTLFDHHEPANAPKSSNLRASSPVQQEDSDGGATSVFSASPSVSTDQTVYGEDEPIAVFFDVGSPTDEFYSSSEAPSLDLDYTYSKWSVGIFMRDADPQGGEHDPIVSINLCGAMNCNADDNDYNFYNGGTVTFSSDHYDLMQGHWPPEVAEYGTGYDVYVLDANGAAAIGPFEFYIEDEYSQVNADKAASHQVEKKESKPAAHESHPLSKYKKGTKASTARQHAIVSSSSAPQATVSNSKIIKASGLEMSSEAYPASATIHAVEEQDDEPCCLAGSISAEKMQYAEDDEVTFTVSIPSNAMSSNYRVGIFMRMASPQGGTLPPIVSLPLCPDSGCLTDSEGFIKKTITFGMDSRMEMQGSQWPLDLYEWGTGFDAFVLDESGNDVTAPTMFNMLMSDSY